MLGSETLGSRYHSYESYVYWGFRDTPVREVE